DVLLLDVRNDYEVGVGTFKGARAIGLDHFRNFPVAVAGLPEDMKQKPVVMFCTGGIRCEKAGPYMEQQGFQNIFQLEGGILKYFEDCGAAHYEGDCFVFDKRVALAPDLKESGLAMCFACQAVLSPEDQLSPSYVVERSCPHCIDKLPPTLPSLEQRNHQLQSAVTPLPGSVAYDNLRPIRIPERLAGQSLAACVAELFPYMSETYWQDEFRSGRVRLGDRAVDGAWIAKAGQRYTHSFPDTIEPPVNATIRVLFEDDSLLVVDKPAPLPMHPSGRFNRNTLIWILRHALALPTLRPIHRLDANTTGIAMFAKTKAFAGQMQRLFDACQIKKTYLAQCVGVPQQKAFECTAPITRSATATGGREIGDATALDAKTRFIRIGISDETATLEAYPITGRTNQIRLHLWHLGHPLVGDPLYLPNHQLGQTQTMGTEQTSEAPMRLHAWRVEFTHPQSARLVALTAPEPTWFTA
ncbi:MAG: RluA family pseudouridine synthase, partial [Planctomycetaceae bacterium]